MDQPRLPRNPVWPSPGYWRETLNDLHWSLYDLWRKWDYFSRYETATFVGGPLDGMSWSMPRDTSEWVHPTRYGEVRYVRWRPVLGSLVASYWRAEG